MTTRTKTTTVRMPPTTETTTTTTSLRNVRILTCIAFLALAQGCTAAASSTADEVATLPNVTRVKRMYAMCPPNFVRIGQRCYYVSETPMNWLDAHFDCKDRNSQLAEPIKLEDRRLRKYMQITDKSRQMKWIGGVFNWQQNRWQWGYSGRDMEYQSFSQMIPGSSQDLKFHCAVLNAALKYRWSAKPCVEKHNFVCQHNMPFVSENNRYKVYAKWNASFPNALANEEVEMVMDDPKPGYRGRKAAQKDVAIAAAAIADNKVNLALSPAQQQTQRKPHDGRPRRRPHQRKPERPFNNTLIDGNGRFADRKLSLDVGFGAPRGTNPRRQRLSPKNVTTTAPTAPLSNGVIATVAVIDLQPDLKRRAEQRLQAKLEHGEKPRDRKRAEHIRKKNERKRKEQLRRKKEHELREQQTPAPVQPLLTEEQRLEEQRLAETRRILGIDGPRPKYHYHSDGGAALAANNRTTSSSRTTVATTSTTTTTTTTPKPITTTSTSTTIAPRSGAVDVDNNINIGDSDFEDNAQRELQQSRIRDEEERQRRRKLQQDEFDRQQRLSDEQSQLERAAQQAQRDLVERQRLEKERIIQAEIDERKERERIEEETMQRELQQRREAEEAHKRAREQQRREKQAKAAEIQRLKERSERNNDTVPEVDQTAAVQDEAALLQAQQEKKRKRDKIHARLSQMSPEMQLEFWARRAERKGKRQTTATASSNNEAAIPQ